MGKKPEMVYTDAEAGLTGTKTQEWFRKKKVAHNITLKHAPVAERMIGYIKNQIINAMRGTDKKWWEVVGDVVREYNEKRVSRSTLMTPNKAAKYENQANVKTQLESKRKTDAPHPRLDPGDKVRVIVKKKFEKGYMPDWSDEVYTVRDRMYRNDAALSQLGNAPVLDRQAVYVLDDPRRTLSSAKRGTHQRSELLLVQKAQ